MSSHASQAQSQDVNNGQKRTLENDTTGTGTSHALGKKARVPESLHVEGNRVALTKPFSDTLQATSQYASATLQLSHSAARLAKLQDEFKAVNADAFAAFPQVKEQKLAAIKAAEEQHRLQSLASAAKGNVLKSSAEGFLDSLCDYMQATLEVDRKKRDQDSHQTQVRLAELTNKSEAMKQEMTAMQRRMQSDMQRMEQLEAQSRQSQQQVETLIKALQAEREKGERLSVGFKQLSSKYESIKQHAPATRSPHPQPLDVGLTSTALTPLREIVADLNIKYHGMLTAVLNIQQQYDNLTTEHVVKQMVDQLEFMYPDVKHVQTKLRDLDGRIAGLESFMPGSINDLQQNVSGLRTEFKGLESLNAPAELQKQIRAGVSDVIEEGEVVRSNVETKLLDLNSRIAKLESRNPTTELEQHIRSEISGVIEEGKKVQGSVKQIKEGLLGLQAEFNDTQARSTTACKKSRDEVDQKLNDYLQFAGKIQARLSAIESILSKPRSKETLSQTPPPPT